MVQQAEYPSRFLVKLHLFAQCLGNDTLDGEGAEMCSHLSASVKNMVLYANEIVFLSQVGPDMTESASSISIWALAHGHL